MRYRLRTLMLAVTAGCVFVGCVAYLLGVQEYRSGDSFAYDSGMTDAYAVAKLVRERSRLPRHELTSEKFMQISDLGSPRIVDQFFYRVKLSDGSETRVGFWVYEERKDARVGTAFAIHAWDAYPEVVSGIATERCKERVALASSYVKMMQEIETDALDRLRHRSK